MRQKRIGRSLRSHTISARALTEWRVRTLPRRAEYADLRACSSSALPATLAIDVGASVGNYSLAMAKAVGRLGRVLALEPNAAVFRELERSVWGSRVTPLNVAASSHNGWAQLHVPTDDRGEPIEQLGSLQPGSRSDAVDVQCIRIDEFEAMDQQVSLMKIDVEGHELEVIRGSVKTISRWHPTLVVEIEARHTSTGQVTETISEIRAIHLTGVFCCYVPPARRRALPEIGG